MWISAKPCSLSSDSRSFTRSSSLLSRRFHLAIKMTARMTSDTSSYTDGITQGSRTVRPPAVPSRPLGGKYSASPVPHFSHLQES
jgi:hypothetical protein